jgi:hypothetical protein
MTIYIRPIVDMLVESVGAEYPAVITRNSLGNVCVGNRLRVRRESQGISEMKLCDETGIDQDDLKAYEQGAKRVSANLLLRFAELLDVRPDYFFQDYTPEELGACLESSL